MDFNTLKQVSDTFYKRTHIPITLVDHTDKLLFPNYSPLFNYIKHFNYLINKDEYPVHVINTYQYLAASFYFKEYKILIGPCLLLGSNFENIDYFSQFQKYISAESLDSFLDAVAMFYMMLTHQTIETEHIPIQYIRMEHSHLETKEKFEDNLYDRRIEDSTRDSYQFELRFLDYIKRGKKDKIDWIFSQINKTYSVSLADNLVDSNKIKFISIVTLMTRLAINEGVPLEKSMSLSDALIQNINKFQTSKEVVEYIRYASYEFIDLIQSANRQGSTLIKECLSYIDTNIYEKITLENLEEVTGNSPVYISTRFKKELGITFSQYVLNKKIEEAKHLLLFTDYSFQEISTQLNFSSQSHFTQRFKNITGLTPKEYRNKNFQYL